MGTKRFTLVFALLLFFRTADIFAQPTTQASAIYFPDTRSASCYIGWTRGDGDSCVVFMKEGTGAITNPVNNTGYVASDNWKTKGAQLGTSGYYCVYNGTNSEVIVTQLKANTLYTVQVYEYNGGVGTQSYLVSTATENPMTFTTASITQANNIYFPTIDSTECYIAWTRGDGDSCAVFLKEGTGAISNPVYGSAYTASAVWTSKGTQLGTSGYYCVYNGTGSDIIVTKLKTGTQYTVHVFEYNGGGGTQYYAVNTDTDNPLTFKTKKKDQVIEFEWMPSVTYGDPAFKIHARASSGLPVSFLSSDPSVASVTDSTVTIHKAGSVEITAFQNGNASYDSAEYNIQTLWISKASLSVTADNMSRKINVANPVFTFSYSGFVKSETESVLTKKPVATCTATIGSQAGDYPIDLDGGEDENYDFLYVPGILTVTSSDCGLQAIITTTVPAMCDGDTINLEANWEADVNYQWYHDGSMVQAGTNNVYTCRKSGKYSVTVASATCVAFSNSVTITYKTATVKPVIEVKSGSIGHCASGGAITLGTTVAYSEYTWSTYETSATIDVYESGLYQVTVPDPSGCVVTSAPYEINASEAGTPSLCLVTVGPVSGKNVVVWKRGTGKIKKYMVYKETTKANKFELVDSVDNKLMNLWVDNASDPMVRSNRYRVSVIDSCGVETPMSDVHKTLHLNLNLRYGGGVNLIWENYEGLEFESYVILEGDTKTGMKVLAEIPNNITSYTILGTLKNYYQISIVLPDTCETSVLKAESGPYAQSLSNIAEAKAGKLISENMTAVVAYPNPYAESITIQYNLIRTSDVRIEFYNSLGQMTAVKTFAGEQAGLVEKTFAASEIQAGSGICLIKVIVGNDIATLKVIGK